ncbi:High affinity cAMP-specific and IBMX-insensitive 3',5'-cyclic phosphodiesterase 9A [Linnemannia exigua]|uniref:Phosphodiesterase n=1 Tax=Linnemannia exigua TaxID=604196 RepID=A0AAD4DB83_9FUNG|nr:High affinity cAMP-specific and IBMX-insensitive 3',5'-cyclic phosphodiesterase 9A [Linnemannia exigua]
MPEIYGYILGMFVKLELVECLGITTDELLDFIIDVDRGYLAIFYHSFYHAADVTSVLYHMLQDMQASQYLSKPDMAALLLAGLCHDIGHPGLNNLFQVNAKTELYKTYGEESVLEKYSCSLAMDLVTKHNLFRNISRSPTAILPEGKPATECGMRQAMVKAILATDMSFHYDMLNNLNHLIEATSTPISSSGSEADSESESELDGEAESREPASVQIIRPTFQLTGADEKTRQFKMKSVSMASPLSTSTRPLPASPTEEQADGNGRQRSSSCGSTSSNSSSSSGSSSSPRSLDGYTAHDLTVEQRQSLCNCLLHAADISNAVKPWTICKRWSDLVVQEFFRQGDIEKAQHLPVSPNMDRDQHNQPQISLGFSDFVVQPYFEAFVELLPDASPLLTTLADNRAHWVELQKSTQQFGYDPYLAVDPLEEPSLSRRPSSPLLSHLPAGRRVSVAAGVLILDDAPPQRTHHRRLRHSTNTETSPGHALRRIKRSLSGRSLSTSLQNLHVLTTRSSSQVLGRISPGHDAFVSVLKRQASLNEKDTALAFISSFSSPSPSPSRSDSIASPLPPLPPPSTPTTSSRPELTRDRSVSDLKQRAPKSRGDVGAVHGGSFRQKRLASLQVGAPAPNTQQVYGDGYTVPKDHASNGTGLASVSTVNDSYAGSKGTHPLSISPAPSPLPQAGNRSSTPAVMMNKIKYDWALSPTLPEIPHSARFGCGPLDGVDETMATQVTVEDTEPAPTPLDTSKSDPTVGGGNSSMPSIRTSTVSPVLRKSVEFALEPSAASPPSAPADLKEGGRGASVLMADSLSAEEAPLGLVVSSSTITPPASGKWRCNVEGTPTSENATASMHPDGTVAISTASSPSSS